MGEKRAIHVEPFDKLQLTYQITAFLSESSLTGDNNLKQVHHRH